MNDFYEILGVNQSASNEDIKKAYRALAREWHPDKHRTGSEEEYKSAEEKFKRITDAYSTLADPDKRTAYDRSKQSTRSGGFPSGFEDILRGFGFANFRSGPRRPPAAIGHSYSHALELALVDALFGTQIPFTCPVQSYCQDCSGSGSSESEMCTECRGMGFITDIRANHISQATCQACRGEAFVSKKACEGCKGSGMIEEERKLTVNIPSYIPHGAKLRLQGMGGKGFGGAPSGDIFLIISVKYPSLDKLNEEEKAKLREFLAPNNEGNIST